MKLRYLNIQNFRGIKELEWNSIGDMVCLIGPGDSTKTTILEAIEAVLYPRWNLNFYDLDFYQGKVSNPIEITALVSDIPSKLLRDDKLGLCLTFWNATDGAHDDQKDGDEYAVKIILKVTSSLEPEWYVEPAQTTEQQRISAADRELLGVTQIGDFLDRDLSWSRGSALARLTGKNNIQEMPSILADASRTARAAVKSSDFKELQNAAKQVQDNALLFGVKSKEGFRPGMDPLSANLGLGALTLMDDDLPLRSLGLGSRRLLVMSIHDNTAPEGSILLIDEVEHGLEPYRLRSLIRLLRPKDDEKRQVIMTTHSSVPIVEMNASELYSVRSFNGKTQIFPVDSSLQDFVRNIPEAFLAHKVIVCEGKTEAGLCRAFDQLWEIQTGKPLACVGTVAVCSSTEGGRTASPGYAVKLTELGYKVAYFGDSDEPPQPTADEMRDHGIEVFLWDGGVCTEERIAQDLPWAAFTDLLTLAIASHTEDSVWDKIRDCLQWQDGNFPRDLEILKQRVGESRIRHAIGQAANNKKWFKRIDLGEGLGQLTNRYLPQMGTTDFVAKMAALQSWCYA